MKRESGAAGRNYRRFRVVRSERPFPEDPRPVAERASSPLAWADRMLRRHALRTRTNDDLLLASWQAIRGSRRRLRSAG